VIEFHRLAQRELRQALRWYRQRSLPAAERFFQQVTRAIDRLIADPASHAAFGSNHRVVSVSRFPFVIVFQIRADRDVFVVAVAHTSRRRGYWRHRM
jgi:plasmid stabilization system protein ParE